MGVPGERFSLLGERFALLGGSRRAGRFSLLGELARVGVPGERFSLLGERFALLGELAFFPIRRIQEGDPGGGSRRRL